MQHSVVAVQQRCIALQDRLIEKLFSILSATEQKNALNQRLLLESPNVVKVDYNRILCLYSLVYCAFQKHTDSKMQTSTGDKCVFRYRQSNVRLFFPASDYCRRRGNKIVEHSSDNETVNGRSRKPGGAAEYLVDGSEIRICRLSF